MFFLFLKRLSWFLFHRIADLKQKHNCHFLLSIDFRRFNSNSYGLFNDDNHFSKLRLLWTLSKYRESLIDSKNSKSRLDKDNKNLEIKDSLR